MTDRPPQAPAGRQGKRIVWTFADQALSSLANAGLSIIVARQVGNAQFGAFSAALLVFAFAMALNRAFVAEPYVIAFSASRTAQQRAAARQATGAAFVNGVVVGIACLGAAVFVSDGYLREGLIGLAITIPLILVQDVWRFVFFAQGRPQAATLNDFVWTLTQFSAIGALVLTGRTSILGFVLAWGLAAGVAAAVGCLQTGLLPSPRATMAWTKRHWPLSSRLVADILVAMGSSSVAFIALGSILGLGAVGAIRGAQVLVGPLQLLFSGISSFALPWLSRENSAGRSVLRGGALAAVAAAMVSAGWVGVLLLLPDAVGAELLGQSWIPGRVVLVPIGVLMILAAATLGGALALKSLGRSDLMLAVSLVQGPLTIVLCLLGAWLSGAYAAAAGFAIAQFVGGIMLWFLLLRVTKSRGVGSAKSAMS